MLDQTEPFPKRVRAALDEIYGGRLQRVVLFGSRARGDARADSDYDVAVFLETMSNRRQDWERLADLRVDLLDETGAFLDAKPFLVSAYDDRTALMQEIRRDGLDL